MAERGGKKDLDRVRDYIEWVIASRGCNEKNTVQGIYTAVDFFVVGDGHPVPGARVELDEEKISRGLGVKIDKAKKTEIIGWISEAFPPSKDYIAPHYLHLGRVQEAMGTNTADVVSVCISGNAAFLARDIANNQQYQVHLASQPRGRK